jgi:hypothetical protein
MRHGWKGEGGMVRQPVFCPGQAEFGMAPLKRLIMKFNPIKC